jgi:hypothetical protein
MGAEIETFAEAGVILRWTTPPAESWTVHYLALGGRVSAARAGWLSPGEALNQASADLVLLVPGPSEEEEGAGGPLVGIGAATRDRQAVAAYATRTGDEPGTVVAAQRHDAAAVAFAPGSDSATLGRLTPGYTLEWDRTPPARRFAYLAIEGVRAKVGIAQSPRRPDTRRTRVEFRPEALLAFTWGSLASNDPKRIGRLCLGAAVAGASTCASWDDCNVEADETRTHAASSDDLLLVADTQTGGIHAQAAVSAVDDRGFILDWHRSDGRRSSTTSRSPVAARLMPRAASAQGCPAFFEGRGRRAGASEADRGRPTSGSRGALPPV